jgi:hypothetical protein
MKILEKRIKKRLIAGKSKKIFFSVLAKKFTANSKAKLTFISNIPDLR